MFAAAVCVACIVMTKLAHAEEVLKELNWEKAPENAELVEPKAPATQPSLKVAGKEGGVSVKVMSVEKPAITSDRYAITGQVKYENVDGSGHLEMWSTFADDNAYFSKTLAPSGPMGVISGTSGWRKFSLPFNSKENYYPKELTVSVVLPGKGTVQLKDLKLVQHSPTTRKAGANAAAAGVWWDDRRGGLIGAIAGVVLGTLGTIQGILAPRGRAKNVMVPLAVIVMGAGITTLVIGLVAVAMGQPYGVYYPLILTGGLAALLWGMMVPAMKRRYSEMEMRRISALDAA
jgi:hypothetical protein